MNYRNEADAKGRITRRMASHIEKLDARAGRLLEDGLNEEAAGVAMEARGRREILREERSRRQGRTGR